jgi:hypothetical protein
MGHLITGLPPNKRTAVAVVAGAAASPSADCLPCSNQVGTLLADVRVVGADLRRQNDPYVYAACRLGSITGVGGLGWRTKLEFSGVGGASSMLFTATELGEDPDGDRWFLRSRIEVHHVGI